jgi:hypothetical protein
MCPSTRTSRTDNIEKTAWTRWVLQDIKTKTVGKDTKDKPERRRKRGKDGQDETALTGSQDKSAREGKQPLFKSMGCSIYVHTNIIADIQYIKHSINHTIYAHESYKETEDNIFAPVIFRPSGPTSLETVSMTGLHWWNCQIGGDGNIENTSNTVSTGFPFYRSAPSFRGQCERHFMAQCRL